MKLPSKNQWQRLFEILNKRERVFFSFFLFAFFSSLFFLLFSFLLKHTKIQPAEGGIFVEGVLEEPKFLNPILATSQTEKDLVFLIFSPLFEIKGREIVPVLAESFEVSEDQKIFKVFLKENIFWEDGRKISADDVVFTVSLIQNPETKSPLRNNWLGVDVEKLGEREIVFKLKEASFVFVENLTLRPLPKHYFENVLPKDFTFSPKNLLPLSSGPFKLEKINTNKEGKILSLELKRNEKYFGEKPKIEKVVFKVFENKEKLKEAAKRNLVEGYFGNEKIEGFNQFKFSLPRYFALFFNLENEILKEKEIRKALNLALNKEEILKVAINGDGKIVDTPLLKREENLFDPQKAVEILENLGFELKDGEREKIIKLEPEFSFKKDLKVGDRGDEVRALQKCLIKLGFLEGEETGYFGKETEKAVKAFQENFKEEILKPSGLEKSTGKVGEKTREKLNEVCFERGEKRIKLEFNLVTGKEESLVKSAQKIKELFEKIGIKINLKFCTIEELENEILPQKNYDLLLFGQMYGKILDPFPFWHSSQIDGGKLNLSNFKNEKVDEILEKVRKEFNQEKREKLLSEFEKIFIEERPAIFLFNPNLNYCVSNKVKGVSGGEIFEIAQRFSQIEKWYLKEKRIWK